MLLEELGKPCETVRYDHDSATRLAPPELEAVRPLGKSPTVSEAVTAVMIPLRIPYLARRGKPWTPRTESLVSINPPEMQNRDRARGAAASQAYRRSAAELVESLSALMPIQDDRRS